ncbi:SDR family NAD(P)-dependent oxidoreductase [Archangium violaceum]|nr:SDR family NAD(P)-dependent oxidoreductase [Archangium violaceum]
MTSYSLEGRRVLVTGGARGLGAGIAGAMARAGADVMVADLLEQEGLATVDALRKEGAWAAFVKLNVTSEAD